jgi:hypothetical protein
LLADWRTWLVAVLGVAAGFLIAAAILNRQSATPPAPPPPVPRPAPPLEQPVEPPPPAPGLTAPPPAPVPCDSPDAGPPCRESAPATEAPPAPADRRGTRPAHRSDRERRRGGGARHGGLDGHRPNPFGE